LSSLKTNDARRTREIKSRFAVAISPFNKKILFTSKFDLNLREKVVKLFIWIIAVCAVKRGLGQIDKKYLEGEYICAAITILT